jgi:CheY-like chemotaxis protein/anti-sigma regulatory factor (Ser/Thr protein kinase)
LSAAHIVDPLRLSQILNNFVSNALKFTRKGWVHIRAELVEQLGGAEKINILVTDTGIGIGPEVQAKLFQAYSQENADTARMYGGTGLGLAICQRLADMLQAQIDLESAPGLGSTFSVTLTLPVTDLAPAKAASTQMALPFVPAHMQADVAPNSPKALVVDDHPINRKLLAIQLGLLGLRCDTVGDGEAALAKWRQGGYALIITDCHMPEMDGYQLTQAIRKIESDEGRPRTPIFAWTANALADEFEVCDAAGMDQLLIKPIEMAALHGTLARWNLLPESCVKPAALASTIEGAPKPPVDVHRLQGLIGNDTHLTREFFQEFQNSATRIAATLRTALRTGDKAAAGKAAHKLKSPAATVGALALGELCARIEDACRTGPHETLTLLLDQFEIELALVSKFMDSWNR